MNEFTIIILAALAMELALDTVSDVLNLRALTPEMPDELSDVYEPAEYRRSQEYTRVRTHFGLVCGAFDLAALLVFWFAGGFNALDEIARSVWDHPVGAGLVYIGALGLLHTLLTLPFGVYATFGIEERFGFNKTTARVFALDQAKALGLLVVLGGPLLAAVLAFFEYGGGLAWVYGWAAVTLFSLAMAFVAPTWILPLFNKFTPMEPGELRDEILDYARSVGFTVSNILVMDGSKRSSKANAFFTGFGRSKRIALFDTLVEKHTTAEMVAVVAHEIGHYKRGHVPQGIVMGIMTTGVLFFLLSLVLDTSGLYEAFYMERESTYAGLVFFGLLYTPLQVVLSAAGMAVSRRHEYQADQWAADTTGEAQALADGLKRMSADNLSNLAPHPLHVFLNSSHPPLLQRVRAIERREAVRQSIEAADTE